MWFPRIYAVVQNPSIGFVQIRSWAVRTAHSNPCIPVFTHVQAVEKIKLEMEWKNILLSFEFGGVRPRHRRPVAPTWGEARRLRLTFADIAPMLPVLGCAEVPTSHALVRHTSTTVARLLPTPKRGNDHGTNQLVTGC